MFSLSGLTSVRKFALLGLVKSPLQCEGGRHHVPQNDMFFESNSKGIHKQLNVNHLLLANETGQSLFVLRHGREYLFHHVGGGWHKSTKECVCFSPQEQVHAYFTEKLSVLWVVNPSCCVLLPLVG